MVDQTNRTVEERLEKVVTPLIERQGLELVELKFHRAGRYQTVRILVDKAGGVSLGDCEKVSRRISADLDAADFLDSRYTLEVSSPGIDRPLSTVADFRRKLGRRVVLEYRNGDQATRTVEGTLEHVDDVAVAVGDQTIEWPQVVEGKLVV